MLRVGDLAACCAPGRGARAVSRVAVAHDRENAVEAKRLLEPLAARRILLVTSALHMPRAAALFRGQGFEVVPAPTDWMVVHDNPRSAAGRALWLLPTAEGLAVTTRALREWLGLGVAFALGWLA
jgi:uncharacterized SAM-binding protein YcdF (DUF218 family)